MATIRELSVRLGIKTDGSGFKKAQQHIWQLTRSTKQLVAAFATIYAARAFTGLITDTAALGDSIDKVASKLGITTDALQELRYAAEQSGVAQGTLDMALQRFIRRSAEAAQGTGVAVKAFEEMGIKVTDASGRMRPAESLFGDVAQAIRNTGNDADRVRLAFALFDSEGVNLVNMLKGGRGALEALRKKAQETGGVMDADLIKSSVEYTDASANLGMALQGVRNLLAAKLLPIVTLIADAMSKFFRENLKTIRSMREWLATNKEMVASKVIAFFSRLGQLLSSLYGFIRRASKGMDEWQKSLSPVTQQLIRIAKIAGMVALALMLPGAPIILLGALIALLIDDFETFRKGGDSVIGDMVKGFEELGNKVNEVWDTVKGYHKDFLAWMAEHQMAIELVVSAILGIAFAFGVAKKAAIASWLAHQAFAVQYYATIWAAEIKTRLMRLRSEGMVRAAWLKTRAAMLLSFGAVAALGALIVWLGIQIYKMLTGQENFFTTLVNGFWNLVEEMGGVFPAMKQMIDNALQWWIGLFTDSESEARKWAGIIADIFDTVVKTVTWPLRKLIAYAQWAGEAVGIIPEEGEEERDMQERAEQRAARNRARQREMANAPALGFAEGGMSQIAAPGAGATAGARTLVSQPQTTNNVNVYASPGMSVERVGEVVTEKINEEEGRKNRAVLYEFVTEAP